MRWFRVRRYVLALVALSFLVCMLLGIHLVTREDPERNVNDNPMWLDSKLPQDTKKFGLGGSQLVQKLKSRADSDEVVRILQNNRDFELANKDDNFHDVKIPNNINKENIQKDANDAIADKAVIAIESKIVEHNVAANIQPMDLQGYPEPNYNVHVFYYVWYGNPEFDKEYLHWNHKRIPHWDKKVAKKYSTDIHIPPDDVGSNFYPELGPYSSRDPKVLEDHMQQIRSTGAGVLAVSWYPPGLSDENGEPWDNLMPAILDSAQKYRLKVCFHIEPFSGRTADTIKQWITYISDTYSSHPAFYRFSWKGVARPLYYLYDSYQVSIEEWKKLLTAQGSHSIRHTHVDAYFIGLLVERKHQEQLHESGFDGYYTYFASDGFTFGSNTLNWKTISQKAKTGNDIFIPSIGPGYIDDRVRPWNKPNTKDRKNGHYYEESFKAAIGCSSSIISITSFNEWHEGTQIERAVPKTMVGYKYLDYQPDSPDFYLKLTKKWVDNFNQNTQRLV